MKIRRMKEADLEKILELENRIFPDPWIRANFEFEIRQNKFSVPLVLEKDEKILGYAILWKIYEEFHIANFAIRPEYQGKKLGSAFLKKILKLSGNCFYAILEVRENNQRAIHLYEKFGFKTILKRPGYYKNGETALVMQKILLEKVPKEVTKHPRQNTQFQD